MQPTIKMLTAEECGDKKLDKQSDRRPSSVCLEFWRHVKSFSVHVQIIPECGPVSGACLDMAIVTNVITDLYREVGVKEHRLY